MFHKTPNPVDVSVFDRRVVNPTTPAVGSPLIWPCPDNLRIHIRNINYVVSTTKASTRSLITISPLVGTDPVVSYVNLIPGFLTTTFYYHAVDTKDEFYNAATNQLYSWLDPNCILEPGDNLIITTNDMGAGVQLDWIYLSLDAWIIP